MEFRLVLPEALEAGGITRGGEGRREVCGAHDLSDRGSGVVLCEERMREREREREREGRES